MKEVKKVTVKAPQIYLDFVNQIFELERKVNNLQEENSLIRNINKIKILIEEELFKGNSTIGLSYHNPMGEEYSETRTDCEATIAGDRSDNLEIIEVIKPIIYYSYTDYDKVMKIIVQPAVVIVKSKNI
jgi:hypothetical protein